jgi:hypothetical protein
VANRAYSSRHRDTREGERTARRHTLASSRTNVDPLSARYPTEQPARVEVLSPHPGIGLHKNPEAPGSLEAATELGPRRKPWVVSNGQHGSPRGNCCVDRRCTHGPGAANSQNVKMAWGCRKSPDFFKTAEIWGIENVEEHREVVIGHRSAILFRRSSREGVFSSHADFNS